MPLYERYARGTVWVVSNRAHAFRGRTVTVVDEPMQYSGEDEMYLTVKTETGVYFEVLLDHLHEVEGR